VVVRGVRGAGNAWWMMDVEPQQLAAGDSEVSGLGPQLWPRACVR
jgi:hypothetical protein